ncbi:hypothetical protein [Fischerella sp. PCC 9605]|uniref:hypothetical protein n=1 Tax=Fischerella sp. PCC 9605 TaxID=1173024 RepID=UPI0004AE9B9C|nr:hypothetical protein [Fischerella sp. PCC 9605]
MIFNLLIYATIATFAIGFCLDLLATADRPTFLSLLAPNPEMFVAAIQYPLSTPSPLLLHYRSTGLDSGEVC